MDGDPRSNHRFWSQLYLLQENVKRTDKNRTPINKVNKMKA